VLQILVLYSKVSKPQKDTKIPSVPQAPNGWGYLACTFQVVRQRKNITRGHLQSNIKKEEIHFFLSN